MLRKLFLSLFGKALGAEARAIAEGKHGDFAKSAYWALEGRKRVMGLLMAAASVALLSLGHTDAAATVGTIAGVAVGAGLLDRAWRSRPDWLTSPLWILVRDHAADVTALLGILAASLTTCSASTAALLAHAHLTCGSGIAIVTAITAVFTWALGEAQMAMPPRR